MSKRPTLEPGSRRVAGTRSGTPPISALDEIRSAIISAVCHGHQNARHAGAPPFLTPMPLDRVVEVARQDNAARLLVACWLLDNPDRYERLVPYAAALLRQEELGSLQFGEMPGTVAFSGRPTEEAPRRTRFAYAYETLRGAACNARNHRLEVSFDPNSLVTNVRASVQVQRPAADFRALADPRCWENRAKLFFKESRHCGLVSGDFETRANESPLVPRTYEGPLLEHVTLGFSPGFPLDAVNVLKLDCDPNGASPTFTVSLHACLESLLGLSFGRGGLDVDGGTFLAEAVTGDPSWTSVSGTKAARFTERDLLGVPIGLTVNYFAPFCLAALMSVLVFEGACFV